MHVLMTVNAAWNFANFRRGLIQALLAEGNAVTILAPADEQSAELTAIGCRCIPLKMDVKGLSPRRELALIARFVRHFRSERPDVILSYTIKNNIFGAFAARALGIPFLPTVTGLGTAFLSGPALQRVAEVLYRSAFQSVPAVFFQNREDLSFFLQRNLVTQDQARITAGSGVDLVRFAPAALPDSGAAPTFLLIGRLLLDKGIREFVEAAQKVRARYPAAQFAILGASGADNRSAIAAETVEAWEASGLVRHHGHTADVVPYVTAADCVVLPSYREGLPRTLLEGAAMGRPLVATDVPGCREVVDDGVNGFLCDAHSAESLSRAMIRFIETPYDRRVLMGRAGRQKVEREYDEAIVVEAYRKALSQVHSLHASKLGDASEISRRTADAGPFYKGDPRRKSKGKRAEGRAAAP